MRPLPNGVTNVVWGKNMTTQKVYRVNEVFYSLQGEGVRAGTANVFVRFSGCNLTCTKPVEGFDCDTEFVSGRSLTLDQLMDEIQRVNPRESAVILTGGEPGLQVDHALIDRLHEEGHYVAIETNGSVLLPHAANVNSPGVTPLDLYPFDWITVSPKVAEHAIKQPVAHEVKYVRGYGQGLPKTVVTAIHYLISPAFDGEVVDRAALGWCLKLVKENPPWRLSTQQHKTWGVR